MEPVLLIDEIHYTGNVHRLKKPKNVFPFTTHSATYIQGNFHIVISELARIITKYRLNKSELESINYSYYDNANKLSEYIANSKNIDFQDDDEARIDFTRFIDTYLFREGQINIIHSYLYNFIGESEKNQNVLKNIAEFISSVFIGEDEELKQIFKNKETDDILTRLIINEIEPLVVEKRTKAETVHYSNLFPKITELFKEDLKFLMKHKDYFLDNFELFVHYYTFMYVLQSIIQFEKFTTGDYENGTPLYFALDWEAVNKKRPVASTLSGYKFIKEHAANLFAHQHVLQQLSHNFLNKNAIVGEKEVLGYSTLLEHISSNGPDYEEQFKEDLKKWIIEYSNFFKEKGAPPTELKDTIEGLFGQLFKEVSKRMNESAQKKYGQAVEFLGAGVFLKQRGGLGYLLNMTHELLMLMTAVIVKDQRMPFKTLIKEFEKRGIAFDRQSTEEILSLFNSQNILDKKSDSGDAQYVKPIL